MLKVKYIRSLGSVLVSFILLLPIYYLSNYDKSLNPDILNYQADYVNSHWTYDIGYEYFANFVKILFGFSFNSYWDFQLLFQTLLLSVIFRNLKVLVIAYPNLLFLTDTLFGTQIRYAISVQIFLIGFTLFKDRKALLTYIVACTFHYGVVIIAALYLYKEKFFKYRSRIGVRVFIQLSVFLVTVGFFSVFIDTIANMTKYSYYVDSHYFESKSIVSIIYAFIFLAVTSYYFFVYKVNDEIIEFSFFCALLVLSTSAFAVVSGRMQIFFFLLEPFLIYSIFTLKNNKKANRMIAAFLWVITLTKFIGKYM